MPLTALGTTEGHIAGGDEGFIPGHVKFGLCIRPPCGDVELAIGYTHYVEVQGHLSCGGVNLGVVSVHLALKPYTLDEVLKEGSVDKGEKRSKD